MNSQRVEKARGMSQCAMAARLRVSQQVLETHFAVCNRILASYLHIIGLHHVACIAATPPGNRAKAGLVYTSRTVVQTIIAALRPHLPGEIPDSRGFLTVAVPYAASTATRTGQGATIMLAA